jgi:hypothetical protein
MGDRAGRRAGRAGLVPLLAVVAVLSGVGSSGAMAADPTPSPRPATCAERYPDEGPAGLDLRAACIIGELLGLTEDPGRPARISQWLPVIGVLSLAGLAVIGVIVFVFGRLKRRFDRRTAPMRPALMWTCPACHSVNEPGRPRCYACRTAWTPDAPVMPVADEPIMIQRFGVDASRSIPVDESRGTPAAVSGTPAAVSEAPAAVSEAADPDHGAPAGP